MIHEENCPHLLTLLRKDCTCPHTHGEHGSHTRVVEEMVGDWDFGKKIVEHYKQSLQFICLDDGVIYKELEITREGK